MTPPATPWTVRPANADDLPELRRIGATAFDREPGDRAALVDLFAVRAPDEHWLGLVATRDGHVGGFAFGSVYGDRGFVDMFAVDEAARGQGAGTALLDALEAALIQDGAGSVTIGGNGRFYAWPGVDVDYTDALALAEHRGYEVSGDAHNMDVDLTTWRPGGAEEVLRRHEGRVHARRATEADWPALSAFVVKEFSDGWCTEVARAMNRAVPTVFIALRGDAVVGFACNGVYRPDWFGPIGTSASERGSGIGEALLRLCLDDLAQAGVECAQISWVGPTGFYTRTVGAHLGRRFTILSKDVNVIRPRERTAAIPDAHTPGA